MSNMMTVSAGSVKIRMYKQGFGDCFLIAFPMPQGQPRFVLIDCGVHHKDREREKKMNRTARSIQEATGGKLDLVIVTHEHTDHIDGFKLATDIFGNINMENVWMGWTEDYADPRVKELDRSFALHLNALKIVRDEMRSLRTASWEMIDNLLGFYAEELGAAGGMSNRETMLWLQKKGGAGMRFCAPGEILSLDGLSDVRFYVLGPPVIDKLLKKSKPSEGKNKETYITDPQNAHLEDFALEIVRRKAQGQGYPLEAGSGRAIPSHNPFEDRFRVPAAGRGKTGPGDVYHEYYSRKNAWRQIDDKWLGLAEDLALKLDEHTNNTSLALGIEIGKSKKILLFPGDAQVGNWLGWDNLKWREGRQDITIDSLLERTALYKVGHHGSHNATLKKNGLEKMTDPDLAALIPVDENFARNVAKWRSIPYSDLLDRLKEKCSNRVIRSDKPVPGQKDRPSNIGKKVWDDFLKRTEETDLYIDLTIPS